MGHPERSLASIKMAPPMPHATACAASKSIPINNGYRSRRNSFHVWLETTSVPGHNPHGYSTAMACRNCSELQLVQSYLLANYTIRLFRKRVRQVSLPRPF